MKQGTPNIKIIVKINKTKAVQRVNALAGAFEVEVKKSEDAKAARYKQEYADTVRSITEKAEQKKNRRFPPLLPEKPPRRIDGKRSRN